MSAPTFQQTRNPVRSAVHTGTRTRTRTRVRTQTRLAELRANPQRGSHATEYAIGIGLAAAVIIALFAAYRLGIDAIIANWFFT